MDQRNQFIRDLERGSLPFGELCAQYGISRTAGYKWLRRFQIEGLEGLRDLSRRPHRFPTVTSAEMVARLIAMRCKHPTWGARKIAARLERRGIKDVPHPSTITDILKRNGLVRMRTRRRHPARPGRPITVVHAPNDLWAVDFKGQFRMRNGQYCYPLTVTDQFSRYLLECKGLLSTEHDRAQTVFDRLFRHYGLPLAIRSDNGSPFASVGLARLSRLSVWWIKLGIRPELIELGCPQQNGAHERMHRTLKAEATLPPMATLSTQQRRFNSFRREFNHERPHEALKMNPPASLYRHSTRSFPKRIEPPEYPGHFQVRYVSGNNGMRWNSQWVNVSSVLAGEYIALEAIDEAIWSVYFYDYLIARFNERTMRLEELDTPARNARERTAS